MLKVNQIKIIKKGKSLMKNVTLEQLLNFKTKDLQEALRKSASISNKNSHIFLPHETKNKICLVAHIDTVLDFYESDMEIKFNLKNKKIINSMMKADDRAGVFACLNIFYNTPQKDRPIVLLCDKEEVGGIGAKEACKKYKKILKDVKYFIELDRRGINDCVFYQNEENYFKRYIESFGFKETFGSFSDISILCRHFRIAGVNLSIGFENEHSKHETLDIPAMHETIRKVREMVFDKSIKEQVVLPEYIPKVKNFKDYYLDNKYDNMLYSKSKSYLFDDYSNFDFSDEPEYTSELDNTEIDTELYENIPDEDLDRIWDEMIENSSPDVESIIKQYLKKK